MQKGFNRVEVLVLATVIIIMLGIFMNFVFDIQKTVRDSKRKGDIETIAKELEVHFNREANQFCKSGGSEGYCSPQVQWFDNNKIPVDPLTGKSYFDLPQDGDKKFMICAKLEKGGSVLETQAMPVGVNSGVYYCTNSQQ